MVSRARRVPCLAGVGNLFVVAVVKSRTSVIKTWEAVELILHSLSRAEPRIANSSASIPSTARDCDADTYSLDSNEHACSYEGSMQFPFRTCAGRDCRLPIPLSSLGLRLSSRNLKPTHKWSKQPDCTVPQVPWPLCRNRKLEKDPAASQPPPRAGALAGHDESKNAAGQKTVGTWPAGACRAGWRGGVVETPGRGTGLRWRGVLVGSCAFADDGLLLAMY